MQALPRPGGHKRPDGGGAQKAVRPLFRQAAVFAFFRRFPANVLKGVRQRVRPAVPVMYQRSRGCAAAFYESYTPFRPFAPGRALLIFPHGGTKQSIALPKRNYEKEARRLLHGGPDGAVEHCAPGKANGRHCEHPNAPLRAALPYGSSGGRQRPNCFGRIGFICSMQPWPWQRITYTSFVVYIIRPFSGDCQSVLPASGPCKPHARTKLFPCGLLCIASGAKARYNR